MPAAGAESLFGAVWVPGDGFLDPHTATYALAAAARELGATIRTGCRVTGIELGSRREVRAITTETGRIECDVVVNAAGACFLEGGLIVMGVDDVREVVARVPTVVAVHLEALNHCFLRRADLRGALPSVLVPEDGETLHL